MNSRQVEKSFVLKTTSLRKGVSRNTENNVRDCVADEHHPQVDTVGRRKKRWRRQSHRDLRRSSGVNSRV